MAEPTNHNEAGEVAPSTVEKQAPSVSEEHSPSTDEAQATDVPTANAPDPDANLVENPEAAQEKGSAVASSPDESQMHAKPAQKPADKKAAAPPKGDKPAAKAAGEKPAAKAAGEKPAAKAAGEKPAAKAAGEKPAAKAAKKEKEPAVEEKPFAEFIQQDYLPALKKALADQGVQDLDLTFEKQKVPIVGFNQADDCWQVMGRWQNGLRQFNIYFPEEDIKGNRAFSCNEGRKPSTLEPFLIDERKITLALMVYGVMQRLNGQKWLALN